MPKVRKTEVDAIEGLLMAEHPDARSLATAIIEQLDALRAERIDWSVIVWKPGTPTLRCYGTWPGEATAKAALSRGDVPIIEGERAIVTRMVGLARMAKAWEKVDRPAKGGKVETVVGRANQPKTDPHVSNVTEIHVLDRNAEKWSKVYAQSGRGRGG